MCVVLVVEERIVVVAVPPEAVGKAELVEYFGAVNLQVFEPTNYSMSSSTPSVTNAPLALLTKSSAKAEEKPATKADIEISL